MDAQLVAQYRCETGEGPLYDDRRNCVFWTDIPRGRMFRIDCETLRHRQIYTGEPVGGFTLQDDGQLLLFRVRDIALLDPDTEVSRSLLPFEDEGSPRFNDTSAAPGGECFAGTMGVTSESGGLFRLDLQGRMTPLFRGTGCSNGMGWTPDRKTMYWTNTTKGTVEAFDYNATTATMGNRRLFLKALPDEGHPDGLAVDSAGTVYSARWGGGGIWRYDPSGAYVDRIAIPAWNVTSMCFAGPDLRDLYVSSAIGGDAPEGGGLFRIRVDVPGQPEFRSRVTV